jgi:AcrR family transcriptional regulator
VLDAALTSLADDGVAGLATRRVAARADTSAPAIYELFGDKSGLVRELFFEGFRRLGAELAAAGSPGPGPEGVGVGGAAVGDPRAEVEAAFAVFRAFARRNPQLSLLMFSRPVAEFEPGPDERAAGATVRDEVIARIGRCVEAGVLRGDPRDIAHVLVAQAQGLSIQESAGWLGSSPESITRRWELAIRSLLDGLAPPPGSVGVGDAASTRPDSRPGLPGSGC